MAAFWHDLRYALRLLARNPGFSTVALLALSLGIGANTAIFSVVNSVLLRPLPYPDADRLVLLWETNPRLGILREGASGPAFIDWKEQNTVFADMAVFEPGSGPLTGIGEPEQILGMRVSANFFDLLHARAAQGRLFGPEDGRGGRQNIGIISHGLWQRRFGGRTDVVGSKARVDGAPYSLIGVLAPDFWFPFPVDAAVPWPEEELRGHPRSSRDLGVLARLKPGVTLAQARAEMSAIAGRIEKAYPAARGWEVEVISMRAGLVEYIEPALMVLLGAVGFVLLIACANVANLLLARAASRRREIALRQALGAGSRRLVRQLLTESAVLGVLGGGLGLLVANWGVNLLIAVLPATVPIPGIGGDVLLRQIEIDWRVLSFTLLVSVVTGILFGLAPALHGARTDVNDALKEAGRGVGASAGGRLRNALVIGEIGLALVLLIGCALMIHSFWKLQNVDPGFRPGNLLTADLELPTDSGVNARYREAQTRVNFYREVLNRLDDTPGIVSAGATQVFPLDTRNERLTFLIPGHAPLPEGQRLSADASGVSPEYFRTVGIALKKGRYFEQRDDENNPRAAIIDDTFAKRYFPGEDPIGRVIDLGRTKPSLWQVVGIVGDVKRAGLDKEPQPTLYLPLLQFPDDYVTFVIRTQADPLAAVGLLKRAVWAVDPDQPVFRVRTADDVVAQSKAAPRLTLVLLAVFAASAVLMAAIGVYGVMSYSVAQRRQEIGIRIALGARNGEVLRQVLFHALRLSAVGVALGLAASAGLTRLLSTLLYGVSTTDPLVFLGVPLVLLLVAAAASLVPAIRAARVDPIVALRYE